MDKFGKMLITIAIIVVVISVIYLAFLEFTKPQTIVESPKPEPIKIGLVGHFSGEYAAYGIPMKQAVELAIEKFSQENNQIKISLIVEDDKTNANDAASA